MAEKRKTTVPYVPFKTFKGFIERLSTTTVPPVVDNSLLQNMSGSMRTHLKSSLRFLDLIKSTGGVTEKLCELVKSFTSDTWREQLAGVISTAYAEVVSDVDLNSGTSAQLETAFRARGNVDGQVLEKAVRFYLGALKDAGVNVSPHITARKLRATSSKKNKTTTKKKKKSARKGESSGPEEPVSEAAGPPPRGLERFVLPIPGKESGIVLLPKDIEEADWLMLQTQLKAYVDRLIAVADSDD